MATTIRVVPIIPSDRAKVDTKALFSGLVKAVNDTNAEGKRFIAKYQSFLDRRRLSWVGRQVVETFANAEPGPGSSRGGY